MSTTDKSVQLKSIKNKSKLNHPQQFVHDFVTHYCFSFSHALLLTVRFIRLCCVCTVLLLVLCYHASGNSPSAVIFDQTEVDEEA